MKLTTLEISRARVTNTANNRLLHSVLLACALVGLPGCGSKEKAPGQSIAKVNGYEITVHQLNEELQSLGAQKGVSKKQVLESLVDRQLVLGEVAKEKIDRDPLVMQAVERAKAQIYAQAYLQKITRSNAKPSKTEIDSFYEKNPDLFADRKQYDLKELIIETKNLSPELNSFMDTAKSIDEVATWLTSQNITFARDQVSRTTPDLPADLIKSLNAMEKGQLFIVKEGARSLLIALEDVKNVGVTVEVAAPQIEQYLINKKIKDAGTAEIARLRATAKIEYLNAEIVKDPKENTSAAPELTASSEANSSADAAGAIKPETKPDDATINRGVSGLK